MSEHQGSYYVPEYSKLPFFTAMGLFFLGFGSLQLVHFNWFGASMFLLGAIVVSGVLFGWFRETIRESRAHLHDEQMGRSYRWGMFWFLFAEFMLFGCLFAALFYSRLVTLKELAGIYGSPNSTMTHLLLWPNFKFSWPLFQTPDPTVFPAIFQAPHALGIPIINTTLLIISVITLRWAKCGIFQNKIGRGIAGLLLTLVLGLSFLVLMSHEYVMLQNYFQVKLTSGIYGNLLYMLVSLQAAHVVIGLIVLSIMFMRLLKGHFPTKDHFALDAATWFWQFVVCIWILIFLFVFWLP